MLITLFKNLPPMLPAERYSRGCGVAEKTTTIGNLMVKKSQLICGYTANKLDILAVTRQKSLAFGMSHSKQVIDCRVTHKHVGFCLRNTAKFASWSFNDFCRNMSAAVHELISSNVDPSCPNLGPGCAAALRRWHFTVNNNRETHDC